MKYTIPLNNEEHRTRKVLEIFSFLNPFSKLSNREKDVFSIFIDEYLELNKKLNDEILKAEKLKWQAISDIAGSAANAMTALGVASNSALLKSIGVVLNGVQTVINGVSQMLTGGTIGFILGLLGIVTGVANTASYFRELEDLQNQNTAQLAETEARARNQENQKAYNASYEAYVANRKAGETRDQYESRYNSENGIASSGSASYSSGVSSVERASAPTYYNISNTYNLNAGAVLGDEFSIDSAFKKLMERYDNSAKLTMAGA